MKFRSENKIKIEGGMSSMTDLVFLLLIFFIIMSTMAQKGVNVDLPSDNKTKVVDPTVTILNVGVTENNTLLMLENSLAWLDNDYDIYYTQDFSPTFSSLTADNGLSISGSDVVLGGTLSQSTIIAGGSQELSLGLTSSQITFLHIDAIQAQERYTAPGAGVLEINKNPGGFNLEIYDPNNQTSNRLDINNNSVLNSINFSTGAGSQQYASPLAAIQMTDDGAGNRSEIVTTIDKSEVGQTVVGTSSTSGLKLNRTTGYKFEDARGGTAAAGLQYAGDYSANFTDNSLVTKKYVDSLDAAQITGVEAGNGLIGGGTAGTVALNLGGTVSSTIVFNI